MNSSTSTQPFNYGSSFDGNTITAIPKPEWMTEELQRSRNYADELRIEVVELQMERIQLTKKIASLRTAVSVWKKLALKAPLISEDPE